MANLNFSQPDTNLVRSIKTLLRQPALFVGAEATVAQAAQAMQNARVGSVLVAAEPPGIVTDRDLRGRVLAAGLGAESKVAQVMTRPLKTIDGDLPAFTALRLMLDENIHHLPVLEEGKIIGVISATDLLFNQANNPLYLRQVLETIDEPIGAARYGDLVGRAVQALFHSGLGAAQIGQVISSLNDALVKRLVELAQRRLGPAPEPYAWIVFGSEGRLEQALLTDQDNAVIYGTGVGAAPSYFEKFARYVVDGLIEAGFPPCPGNFMATHWRKSLVEAEQLFAQWIRLPQPQALLDASIFFDFRAVAGTLSLESLEQIIATAAHEKLFLAHMLSGALAFRPPLGFFNRVRRLNGKIDLKKGAIAPIVGLARVAALAAGSRERSTLERLAIAGPSGAILSQASAAELGEIFPYLLRLRLRAQLTAYGNHQPLDHCVDWATLSTLEQRHLREAMVLVKEIQEQLQAVWRLDRLG